VTGSTYAVLVAVEHYQQSNIRGVPFAVADAEAMMDVLVQEMKVPVQNIELWTDQDATRSRLENDLPYEISQLGPDDRFIFFYAGHGFYAQGSNRLTTWDTHTLNIIGTTTCLDKVLLSPLKNGRCRKSLVFIDACATTFGDGNAPGRNVLLGMHSDEFAEFVKSTDYRAAFFSCSLTQQSYSWPGLKHGIWTHHLLRAFSGQDEAAFERDRCITGNSLQTYLAVSIPAFIAKETDIKASQRPYAELAANGAFEILHVLEGTAAADEHQPRTETSLRAPVPVPIPIPVPTPGVNASAEYWAQRKRLPVEPLVKTIWQLPHCRIWSRPETFKKARFRNLDGCAQFVGNASVRSRARWSQYPWFSTTPEYGDESIGSGIELTEDSIKHFEQWRLFQSGQFVHYLALDQVPQLGKRTHVLEILDTTTALFEFVGRMAERKIFTEPVAITFEYKKIDGRQLTWPEDILQMSNRVSDGAWCQDDTIVVEHAHEARAMIHERRTLALKTAVEIYAGFGWNDPPTKELETAQQQRFGQPTRDS
jgi:hypothetical protein